MGQEAEAILLRYLGSTYAVSSPREADTASLSNTHGHGPLFTFTGQRKSNNTGINVPPVFQDHFDCVSDESPLKPSGRGLQSAFQFEADSSSRFFDVEKHSEELLSLGASLSSSNPLTSPVFKSEDAR